MDDLLLYQKVASNENEAFNLYIQFKEDSFVLEILQNSKAWKFQINKSFLRKQADNHGLDFKEYYNKLKSHFKLLSEDVQLNFSNNTLTLNILLKNEMKYVYFACNTKEVSFNDCVMNMIDNIYSKKCFAVQQLEEVSQKSANYHTRATELENKLEEFIQRKKTDEEEMYSNFLAILNEKKRQIQHLNELLIAFRQGRPTLNSITEVKKRKSKKDLSKITSKMKVKQDIKVENNEESDSDTSIQNDNIPDSNYNTDDEKEKMLLLSSDDEISSEIDKSLLSSPLPSTSKQNFDILFDESPPRYHLPKRIKTENKTNTAGPVINFNEASTSKESSPKDNVKNEVVNVNQNADVNYNTQDLLDNL